MSENSNANFFQIDGATGSRSREGVVQWVVPYFAQNYSEISNIPKIYQSCEKVSLTFNKNNDGTQSYIATATYEGPDLTSIGSDDEYNKPAWSIDFDLQEQPIEAHWNFPKIKEMYGGRPDPNDEESWIFPDTMPQGKSSGTGLEKKDKDSAASKANPMKGVRTYIVMLSTVTKSYTRKTPPSDIAEKIGKQMAKIPKAPSSFNDLAKGKRTWMQLPPKISKRGKAWEVTESWRLSEYNKWPEKVYIEYSSNKRG